MLDLAWSEIALIAVVAVVVIGPKDLPGAVRGVADLIKKGKRQLASFQQQADELVREANLEDVRNQIAEVKGTINEIRSFDLKGELKKHVDGDGTLTKTFSENPLDTNTAPVWTPPPTAREVADAPAMIPPQTMAPPKPVEEPKPAAADAPSFVPPATPAPPPGVTPVAPEPEMPPALSSAAPRQG
ncbi:Sec-independent protein translocase protein TatB [Sabulicella glaciei]|uniref:Sec-independent protein translocase protein TatB n=1 Tax=Sabulicella glaciei TaxID=2984948 RepID=A0ABT3NVV5_9PROT|nr:Sec-independent protein translocase protein TatB [Roseococcus sp. MDT2-1-1]MCW8086292.1 Sec-independent protein translocase protein TatB [Roseococcus sp. MDT2-1-1]